MATGQRSRVRHDRGASTVEFVLTMPVLLLTLLLTVQFALITHAQSGAQAAAEEGAAAARAFDGSGAQGEARARRYVNQLSGSVFTSTSIRSNRSHEQASVTVTGTVQQLVPGIPTTVTRTSTGPVERFVEEPP